MNVISYLRVSGQSQVDGDGFDRQREAVGKFCEINNLDIRHQYREEGVSGTVEGLERPAFASAINHAETQDASIIVERLDRLARDLMVQELLLQECRLRGVKVFAADQPGAIDLASNEGDPTRVLIRQIMGALAQWEKSVIVKKLRTARDRKRKETGRCEGRKLFGTDNLDQKKVLLRILEMRDIRFPIRQIKMALDAEGFQTSKGKGFSVSFIGELCRRHRGPSKNNAKGKEDSMKF
jgi:DNA invertase Pin-like site-specific DNA recombinase